MCAVSKHLFRASTCNYSAPPTLGTTALIKHMAITVIANVMWMLMGNEYFCKPL